MSVSLEVVEKALVELEADVSNKHKKVILHRINISLQPFSGKKVRSSENLNDSLN